MTVELTIGNMYYTFVIGLRDSIQAYWVVEDAPLNSAFTPADVKLLFCRFKSLRVVFLFSAREMTSAFSPLRLLLPIAKAQIFCGFVTLYIYIFCNLGCPQRINDVVAEINKFVFWLKDGWKDFWIISLITVHHANVIHTRARCQTALKRHVREVECLQNWT